MAVSYWYRHSRRLRNSSACWDIGKFGLSPEEIAPLVDDLMSLSTIVHPRHTVDVVTRDPTDNLFLEIALQGKCSVLVSGDRHLLELRQYRRTRILTPTTFVRSVRESEGS